jgi:o-succinylbenzoate---CoA ligase
MERRELAALLGAELRAAEPADRPAVVEEADPAKFSAAFATAVAGGGPVFLADPGWGAAERSAFSELLALRPESRAKGWLMIPSGGTGGRLKFARHDEDTIAAAVNGFCEHAGKTRINCVGVLPMHHVSGFMAWMRTVLTGGTWLPWDWKRLSTGDHPALTEVGTGGPRPPKLGEGGPPVRGWFISLVPTQLQRLLASPETTAWLRDFDAIFIGGGPLWPDLAAAASAARLPLSPSYGMTETAAMVAALPPAKFLKGDRSCGTLLPHARLALDPDGGVRIAGASIFRGYYPDWSEAREFLTDDLGRIDEHGHLHILGRRDAVIITGGKKVDPIEVEGALLATGQFSDVAVIGLPDPDWGQAVVACYPSESPVAPDLGRVAASLESLAAFKRPRRYLAIANWPRNEQGKLNQAELARRALAISATF